MNNNLNNNYNFDPMTGQPINQSQQPIQNATNMYVQQPVQPMATRPQQPKKKINLKLLIIIAVATVVLVAGIILVSNLFDNKEYSPVEVSSTFEQKNGHYVLQDENGNILLDNIKSYGKFCNGTTEVQNTNGEYGIIDGSGKFIAEYGKYDIVDQYSSGKYYYCFYEVTDTSNDYQKYILKYDGSILYSNENDKKLRDADIEVYSTSTRFVLFTTKDKYQFLNYLGEPFLTFNRSNETSKPILLINSGINGNEKYISVYYEGKTYIYNLYTFKPALDAFEGKYSIGDINLAKITTNILGIESKKEEESLIIFGYPNADDESKRKTFLVEKGKITFEIDKCLNVAFVDGNNLRCLIKNGGVYEYYDINGNLIDKN